MSDANLDIQPSSDRFRKRLERMKRHPKEYAEERKERVGDQVEKVGEDQERNQEASELLLFLRENEEEIRELLGVDLENVTGDLQNYDAKQWEDLARAFARGDFHLSIEAAAEGARISVDLILPEGNIQEKIPLSPTKQREILARMQAKNEKKFPKRKAAS